MEDKELLQGSFGQGGSYKVAIVSKNVVATISFDSDELTGSASLTVKSKAGLEALKKAIPGTIDDAILSVVEAALGV